MPDLEGALPLILLMIFLWVRSIGAAMKRNRQRQEQALAQGQGQEVDAAESDGEALHLPGMPDLPPDAGVATTAPARRPSLREQLREMGRQLEEQMQQAAEEGRPGSLVGHVEPGEEPETPGMLRPTPRPAPAQPVRPAAPPAAPSPTRGSASPLLAPPTVARRRGRVRRRGRAGGEEPLERLDRYPTLARAVILSEILGQPPGLSDDRK